MSFEEYMEQNHGADWVSRFNVYELDLAETVWNASARVHLERAAEIVESEETIDQGARNKYAKAHHTNGPKTLREYAGRDVMAIEERNAGFVLEAASIAIRKEIKP